MAEPLPETAALRLRAALESAPSGIVMTDAEGRIVLVNREVERLFGYPREELLGRSVDALVPARFRARHPGDRAGFLRRPSVRTMGAGRDLHGRRKDGTEVPVEIGLTPVATEEGLFVVASIVDISARQAAEEERGRLLVQLQEAQRVGVIGTLAGGVAHDFNTLLGAIIGYAELARTRLHDPATTHELDALLTAAEHGRHIVDRILQFTRQTRPEPQVLDLPATVHEALQLVRSLLPSSIELDAEIPLTTLRVLGDATSVHQVLMNLASNGAQAMPDGGRLRISLGGVYLRDHASRALPNLHEGDYALLVVEDSGEGMPPEVVARAFDPFYTTKPVGRGSGLGLAMVRQLIHEHGGAVGLESRVGAGTVVRCYFPVAEPIADERAVASREPPPGAGERLLVVEDEPMLLEVGVRRLADIGYAVTGVGDGREALALVEADPYRFDLVVTDFTMPRMNGLQLATRLHEIAPALPILLMSGYVDTLDPERIRAAGVRRTIAKPLTLFELATEVRAALDQR